MGREFLEIFEVWADNYDQTVEGHDVEYEEVFAGYTNILDQVVQRSLQTVLEFGVGTGNLTKKLLDSGKQVIGVEPSEPMRNIAFEKLNRQVEIYDGDFLDFNIPSKEIDTIVSTYAFHHLTDQEKDVAISRYASLLPTGGKVVFADTVFEDTNAYDKMVNDAKQKGFLNLAKDLQTEYYTTIGVLKSMFEKHGFNVTFTRSNPFVWIMEAEKL